MLYPFLTRASLYCANSRAAASTVFSLAAVSFLVFLAFCPPKLSAENLRGAVPRYR